MERNGGFGDLGCFGGSGKDRALLEDDRALQLALDQLCLLGLGEPSSSSSSSAAVLVEDSNNNNNNPPPPPPPQQPPPPNPPPPPQPQPPPPPPPPPAPKGPSAAGGGAAEPKLCALYKEAELRLKSSSNTTECVPVPSSEHVAEIVGRQGERRAWGRAWGAAEGGGGEGGGGVLLWIGAAARPAPLAASFGARGEGVARGWVCVGVASGCACVRGPSGARRSGRPRAAPPGRVRRGCGGCGGSRVGWERRVGAGVSLSNAPNCPAPPLRSHCSDPQRGYGAGARFGGGSRVDGSRVGWGSPVGAGRRGWVRGSLCRRGARNFLAPPLPLALFGPSKGARGGSCVGWGGHGRGGSPGVGGGRGWVRGSLCRGVLGTSPRRHPHRIVSLPGKGVREGGGGAPIPDFHCGVVRGGVCGVSMDQHP